jgi:hypothetical protein
VNAIEKRKSEYKISKKQDKASLRGSTPLLASIVEYKLKSS